LGAKVAEFTDHRTRKEGTKRRRSSECARVLSSVLMRNSPRMGEKLAKKG
jgi:hypothetical protein